MRLGWLARQLTQAARDVDLLPPWVKGERPMADLHDYTGDRIYRSEQWEISGPMTKPRTVGEVVEERGVCMAMVKVADLAQALKRIPFGEWDYRFTSDPRWRICVNGGKAEWTPPDAPAIPRFNVYVEYNGWPMGFFDAADGALVGSVHEDPGAPEARLIAALEVEIARATGEQ